MEIEITNPISSDLNVLRRSIFSNLIIYLKKTKTEAIQIFHYLKLDQLFLETNQVNNKLF